MATSEPNAGRSSQSTPGDLRSRLLEPATDEAIDHITPIISERWTIDPIILRDGIQSYIHAVCHSIEQGSAQPLEDYFASLDSLWQADQFAIDPLVRSMFLIGDIMQRHAHGAGNSELAVAIEQMTRSAIEVLSRRSVSIITNRLANQVARHQEGEARLISMHRVSSSLLSDIDLDQQLELIADEARRLMHADSVGIRLSTDDGQLKHVRASGAPSQFLENVSIPIDESLSGVVFHTGQTVRVRDVNKDPRVRSNLRRHSDARSLLIAPLTSRSTPLGVIIATAARTSAFSRQDEQVLELFADQAASAIENARLYQQAQDQIQELEMLHRVSRIVSSSLNLDEIFQTLCDAVSSIMPTDAFVIALTRSDGLQDVEFLVEGDRRFPPRRGVRLSPVVGESIDTGETVVHHDVTEHRHYGRAIRFGSATNPVRSVIVAPLKRGTNVIGIVSAQAYLANQYRASDARILGTIANQAAIAIEHARLYQQAQNMAVAEERSRLAREIHDTLAQGLVGIILCLDRIDQDLQEADTSIRPWVGRALELARSSLDEARRSVRDLRAAPLEGRTLLEALANLTADVADNEDFDVTAVLPQALPTLSARVETALFRVVQEAITNTRKHAQCSSLNVEISISEDILEIRIEDNGVGFHLRQEESESERFGLATMHERVHQIGGTIDVISGTGKGTLIRVIIPLALALYRESDEHTVER